ncbi:MAG: putative zinc-binding metallopeptidase, partial [Gammaproteobacteria bacterium]|nr:putative zinc-binding metallopeptidase [Gammaproteobacteria bacterium]
VKSEIARQYTRELYRTLLGHFRHESGHYYFLKLITGDAIKLQFVKLFGDYKQDYGKSLKEYYKNHLVSPYDPSMISHYAQSHPWEDWAEIWAHYLHMIDTLETANQYRLRQSSAQFDNIDNTLRKWGELTLLLNSLNRSMGLEDAYPFVLSELSLKKLRFVHGLIYPN